MIKTLQRCLTYLFGSTVEFRAALFNLIAVMGIVFCVPMIAVNVFRGDFVPGALISVLVAAVNAGLLWYVSKSGNYLFGYLFTVIVIFLGLFPMLFFTSGGYIGGRPMTFIPVIVLTWIMLEGTLRAVFCTLELVVYSALVVIALYYPELVVPHKTQAEIVVDILTLFWVGAGLIALTLARFFSLYDTQRRELEIARRSAEEQSKLKSEIFSRMSHEMRTPLSVISLYARLAARQIRRGTVSDQTIADLKTISGEAERLADMANGTLKILTTSLDASGAGGLHLTPVDIGAIAQRVVGLMRHASAVIVRDAGTDAGIGTDTGSYDNKGNAVDDEIDIVKDTAVYAMNITPGKKPVPYLDLRIEQGAEMVQGDGDVLMQLFWNMLSNSVSISNASNVTITIRAANEKFTAVSVEDDGDGIPPDLLPRVFDKGVSGTGGSGIGLSICKDIAKWHGGEIFIESELGKGTKVTVTLQRA